ncbi:MAG: redoxin family protein [Flavobacteriaceae bacterium]|jgi:thiol-disulfide isomerase/thioredoxin|nr:redoxin family protein [Flavobacteriaceae bacterium]
MKKVILLTFSLLLTYVSAQEAPAVSKTEFSEEALAQTITGLDGQEVTIASVLEKHKGKIVVLELWAGWCKDCLEGLPAAHELRKNNPDVDFVHFSLDKNFDLWKKNLEKFELQNGDNYWFSSGWKNVFDNYIDLNWIPRFIVISPDGKIAKYYAVTADDPEVRKAIDELLK